MERNHSPGSLFFPSPPPSSASPPSFLLAHCLPTAAHCCLLRLLRLLREGRRSSQSLLATPNPHSLPPPPPFHSPAASRPCPARACVLPLTPPLTRGIPRLLRTPVIRVLDSCLVLVLARATSWLSLAAGTIFSSARRYVWEAVGVREPRFEACGDEKDDLQMTSGPAFLP
ncbi:hypothetical protein KC19_3G233500 [Ceratodon purpureus]|uniref:Uncharacterized protein n=1 Tax=Ceratodon purpureus TaxID=3225 RepID=A0A8T0IPL6_CERPU|nr:hypothetical protein KC19_3G233500 [Ceratodon purpureus]